jgi:hypothetical protein
MWCNSKFKCDADAVLFMYEGSWELELELCMMWACPAAVDLPPVSPWLAGAGVARTFL